MIEIGHLNLNLPQDMQSRAHGITRHVGQALADVPMTRSVSVDYVGNIEARISAHQSNKIIGQTIATAIHSRLMSQGGRGNG